MATLSLLEVKHPCCSTWHCRCRNEGNTVTETHREKICCPIGPPNLEDLRNHASRILTYIVHIYLFYLHYIRCLSFSSFKGVVYVWSQEKDAPVAIATTVAPIDPRGSLDRMIYIIIATLTYSNMLDAEGTIILPKASLYAIRHGIDPSRSQSSSNPPPLGVNDRTILHIVLCFYSHYYTVLVPPHYWSGHA
jgi:hypothetical protein